MSELQGRGGSRAATLLAWVAIGLGLYLYFGRLGASPLQAGSEAMYAAHPIHMLESGDYLVPRFHGKNFLDKPPLSLWLIAASYSLFGVSEWAARLPAALISLATVLVVALWVRRRSGNRAAWLAALVLIFMHSFWTSTRFLAADALLAFTVTLSVLALDVACRKEGGRNALWGALAGGALGLAFLSKGLVGVVLPLGAVGAGLALDRVWPVRAGRRAPAAAAVLLTLIVPWHWAMTHRLGAEFWRTFYWENQFLRGATSRYGTTRNPLYYLFATAWAAFPWSFLLPGSLRRQKSSSAPLGWLLFGLAFWSVLAMKRQVYLMPVFPPIAILVAERLDREESDGLPGARRVWILVAVVLVLGLVLLGWIARPLAPFTGWSALSLLGAALALELALVLAAARGPSRFAFVAGIALACGLCFLAVEHVNQTLERYDPVPQWGQRTRLECRAGCDGFLIHLNTYNLEFYSRFAWIALDHPREEFPERTRYRKGFFVLPSSDEPILAELPIRSDVVDRRPWLPGNWISRVVRQGQSPVESISLVRFEVLAAQPSPSAP